jgi:hypothetical protein
MPQGLDPDYVTGGVDYGHVRRPVPVAKALDDVILAYEMNGRPLPVDNGFPLRFICPSWIGVANVKWVGQIEVSATPLFSYWNTLAYRLFGPTYPADGTLITRQVVKSSFELEWDAQLAADRPCLLTGRSWSGNGGIAHTEVSTDGQTWQRAAARAGPPACLAALGNPLAAARARLLHAALPRHRRHGRHPARHGALQHPRIPLRRDREPPRHGHLSTTVGQPGQSPQYAAGAMGLLVSRRQPCPAGPRTPGRGP